MRLILTALIFLTGLFDLFMATSFLINPQTTASGAVFGIAPIGVAGLSTIRGDMTSFFGVGAVCMMWGAWRRNADLLLVPALLFGTTLAGRALNLAVVGAYPGWEAPMAVEAFHVALLLAAWRLLPHHKIAEITG
jgi:hypothetical protein